MRYHFVHYHFVCYHFEGLMRYYLYQNCCKFSFKNVLFKNFFEKNSKKYCHFIVTEKSKKSHKAFIYGLCGHIKLVFILFKLAKFGLILVVSISLSILYCIDNMHLFHSLFFVSHIFSTNPVPTIFFIIVCSSGGLQVI